MTERHRPKVYVTQEQHFDFTAAHEFGDVEFLTNNDLSNNMKSIHNREMLAEIRQKLRRFDPDTDWLLIAGSPYVSAAAFLILGNLGHKSVRVLRWSNRDLVYIPICIELPNY